MELNNKRNMLLIKQEKLSLINKINQSIQIKNLNIVMISPLEASVVRTQVQFYLTELNPKSKHTNEDLNRLGMNRLDVNRRETIA